MRIDGKPFAGARVRAAGTDAPLATTDADGAFELVPLPDRKLSIEVHQPTARGFSRIGRMAVPAHAAARSIEFDLAPLDVEFALRWPDGSAAAELRIEIARFDGDEPAFETEAWGLTGANGMATLRVAAPGRYRAIAQRHDRGRGGADFTVDGATTRVSFELARCKPCSGRVMLPDGGKARGWWRLDFRSVDGRPEIVRSANMNAWLASGHDDFSMPNVVPGRYVALLLEGGGETLTSDPFFLPSDGSTELVLRFSER